MGSVYSVTEINSYIKHMFEEDFALGNISIKGEISNCKYHSSGHIYFTLKEEASVLSCVMFASYRKNLSFNLKEGLKVVAKGSISVYERDGKYQLYAKEITQDGEGELYRRFEALKKELMEMGMFETMYKKPIPKYATRIGIVTASTGAAIRDIINITKRRNPHTLLYLYSAIVQGTEAKASICKGIETLDAMGLDVIIVGRGGGSIEDLWAFNEEDVARAIFVCNTPVITAVGHETDTTIADFVADLRAPTPSAAAELAVFNYNDFQMDLISYMDNLHKYMTNKLTNKKMLLEQFNLRLERKSPQNQLILRKQQLLELKGKLESSMENRIKDARNRLCIYAEKLNGLSPLTRLEGGYSYVSKNGHVVKDISTVSEKDIIDIDVVNGHIKAEIREVSEINR